MCVCLPKGQTGTPFYYTPMTEKLALSAQWALLTMKGIQLTTEGLTLLTAEGKLLTTE